MLKGFVVLAIILASLILPARATSIREFPQQVWDRPTQLVSLADRDLSPQELGQEAFRASERGDFATAEVYWTKILADYPENAAAWSNRGITRASQGKLEDAIADYDRAIALTPLVTDPYLNRGAALEALGQFEDAIADYNRILKIDPGDAQAYNNRGNAKMGLADWQGAIADYQTCTEIAPNFAFAFAGKALATYQVGDTEAAIQLMRNVNRKYPQFADMRAALSAALWASGKQGEAESNWVAAVGLDSRYRDISWVKNFRRWPPAMLDALQNFLDLS
ncbi:tetratricopeptide repeat protein [Roseofilum casamattae]|nr:tetratricopeptide repeat protein [Roseofilum casamattae]